MVSVQWTFLVVAAARAVAWFGHLTKFITAVKYIIIIIEHTNGEFNFG